MKWLASFRDRQVRHWTMIAGAAGTVAALVSASSAVSAWTFLSGLSNVATSILCNFASEAFRTRPNGPDIGDDLRSALAKSLQLCLTPGPRRSAPLLAALRESGLDLHHVSNLMASWKRYVDEAVRANDFSVLTRLFPAPESEQQLLDLAANLSAEQAWLNFYRQTLGSIPGSNKLVKLCGGIASLEATVPAALSIAFPSVFADVLKSPRANDWWVAYQKANLEQIRSEIGALDESVAAQGRAIDMLLEHFNEVCAEQRHQMHYLTTRFDVVDASLRIASSTSIENTRLINDVRSVLRAENAPRLSVPEPYERAPLGIRALRFSERLIATQGRNDELYKVRAFLDEEAPLLWWAIVGSAGMGKSHLALHIVEERIRYGWTAGFLESSSKWMEDDRHPWTWQPEAPTLIVIDYASGRARDVYKLLAILYERRHSLQHRTRVLLVDRPGGIPAAFTTPLAVVPQNEDDRSRVERGMYRADRGETGEDETKAGGGPRHRGANQLGRDLLDSATSDVASHSWCNDSRFLQLGPLSRIYWRSVLTAALARFGETRDLPDDTDPLWANLGHLSDQGCPLLLLVAATVLAAGSENEKVGLEKTPRNQLIRQILERDRARVWATAAGMSAAEWSREHKKFERAIALATLVAGIDCSNVVHRTALREFLSVDDEYIDSLGQRVSAVTGWSDEGRRINPLQPDLIGEYLLAHSSICTEADLIGHAFQICVSSSVETICRIAKDFPEHGSRWIEVSFKQGKELNLQEQSEEVLLESVFEHPAVELVHATAKLASDLGGWPPTLTRSLLDFAAVSAQNSLAVIGGLGGMLQQASAPERRIAFDLIKQIGSGGSSARAALVAAAHATFIDLIERNAVASELDGCVLDFIAFLVENKENVSVVSFAIKGIANASRKYAGVRNSAAAEKLADALILFINSEEISTFVLRNLRPIAAAIAANLRGCNKTNVEKWINLLITIADLDLANGGSDTCFLCVAELGIAASNASKKGKRDVAEDLSIHIFRLLTNARTTPGTEVLWQMAGLISAMLAAPSRSERGITSDQWLDLLRRYLDAVRSGEGLKSSRTGHFFIANAISAFGAVGDFSSVEYWARMLVQLNLQEGGESPRQLSAAAGICNAIIGLSKRNHVGRATYWMQALWRLYEAHGARHDWIAMPVLSGLRATVEVLSRAGNFYEIGRWVARLRQRESSGEFSDKNAHTSMLRCVEVTARAFAEKGKIRELDQLAVDFISPERERLPQRGGFAAVVVLLYVTGAYGEKIQKDVAAGRTRSASELVPRMEYWCNRIFHVRIAAVDRLHLVAQAILAAMRGHLALGDTGAVLRWAERLQLLLGSRKDFCKISAGAAVKAARILAEEKVAESELFPDVDRVCGALVSYAVREYSTLDSEPAADVLLTIAQRMPRCAAAASRTRQDFWKRCAGKVLAQQPLEWSLPLKLGVLWICDQAIMDELANYRHWSQPALLVLEKSDWSEGPSLATFAIPLMTKVAVMSGEHQDVETIRQWRSIIFDFPVDLLREAKAQVSLSYAKSIVMKMTCRDEPADARRILAEIYSDVAALAEFAPTEAGLQVLPAMILSNAFQVAGNVRLDEDLSLFGTLLTTELVKLAAHPHNAVVVGAIDTIFSELLKFAAEKEPSFIDAFLGPVREQEFLRARLLALGWQTVGPESQQARLALPN